MRILHTADWHVGKTLRGRSRADEHRAVLGEMAALARDESVDLVIVAGDLFDSAAPTAESEELVYRALLVFTNAGAHVVIVAGNHDSAHRMRAIRPLLSLTRIHSVPFAVSRTDGGVLDITTERAGRARIAVLPFL
jgi:DNA repair protein SbcD/Mre11